MLEERGGNVRTQWPANKESHPCGGIKSEVWGFPGAPCLLSPCPVLPLDLRALHSLFSESGVHLYPPERKQNEGEEGSEKRSL